jgi:hypothetical protein
MMNVPDRIYAQYRGKPKTEAWLDIVPTMIEPLVGTAAVVRNMYNIDAMQGEQLNIIGRVVVVPRGFLGNTLLSVSEFALLDGAEFGDETAVFSATSIDTDMQMSDELYRLAIRAKISKNNSDATIDSILDGVNQLIPHVNAVRLIDPENMTFTIEFYGAISDLERWALIHGKMIAKPQGVRFAGFLEGAGYVECGDSEQQFGDESAQCVGLTGVS